MIQKVLIANRGEIAVRVMRSCKEMGIRTVAVFSEADRTARHVMYADEACLIGPAASKESYLNIDNIIKAARQHHADAIHPGYGFLSENADFARRCKEEGIIFIGPSAETMEAMGDKIAARKRMIAAGVPVVPGTEQPLQSAEEAVRICNEIGYPVMLKASMGGGGKGMRLIHSEDEVVEAYNTARSESMSSFGDDTVYLEKFVEEPHHIEFQILGDNHGNVIHLFDRECSVQRRNQKIVEESPSPFLTPELRQEMGEKAVAAARAVNYSGAGTIEFLVDKNRNFYFLEMNTNGWAYAALARVMNLIPRKDKHYKDYLKDFLQMSKAIKLCQREDGFWNVSLHDPGNFGGKEGTGTALFVYGLAWGIRNGILDRDEYLPMTLKAWNALVKDCMHPNGALGYMQGRSNSPKAGQPLTYDCIHEPEDFAVGCFLLAASEIYKLK